MTAFKDYYDKPAALALGERLATVHTSLDVKAFAKEASRGLAKLEMMGRVGQFADTMRAHLPEHVPDALAVLTESLGPELSDVEPMEGFALWPDGEFIRRYATGHFDEAFDAMVELTKRFSSEFAVRPFVRDMPEATFARLLSLTNHDNEHVRRWCSEGVRTRLPWGERLVDLCDDPSPILPILEALKDDPSLYVRRSVANCWGDIAKDHTDMAVDTLGGWANEADSPSPERLWLVRHALRSPVKAGHRGALAVMGFRPTKKVRVDMAAKPGRVKIGERVALSATVTNTAKKSAKLLVDYRIHYVKAGGKVSPKVFKWKELELGAGESVSLKKNIQMRHASIRKLYPGAHAVDVQVNGLPFGDAKFVLSE